MCYSKEQSIISLIVNLLGSLLLYSYNTNVSKILSLFSAFVGTMQFHDYILWTNLDISDPHQKQINRLFTKIAMITNHLQPVVLGLLIILFLGKLKYTSLVILILYIIVSSIYSIYAYNKIDTTGIKEKENLSSLNWEWNDLEDNTIMYSLFMITLVTLFLQNFKYPLNIISALFSIISFLLSTSQQKINFVGRFWCKTASYMPILFYILGKMNILSLT